MADITLVEDDTGITIPFALTAQSTFVDTTNATSVTLICGAVSITCTVLGVGLHSFPADSLAALDAGSYRAQVKVVWPTSQDQYFPDDRAWTVEILPHTRSRA